MRQVLYLRFWILFLALGLLFLLLSLPVQLHIVYEARGRSHRVRLELGIFGGRLKLNKQLPSPRRQKTRIGLARRGTAGRYRTLPGKGGVDMLAGWRRLRRMITGIRRSLGVFEVFLSRSVCTRLCWVTEFGTGDYAATGMLAGFFWAVKGLLVGLLSRHLQINPSGVKIVVTPRFSGAGYESTLDCILETSLGYIMISALKLCAIWLIQSSGISVRRKRYA